MTVAKFQQPDSTTQTASAYKAAIESSINVMSAVAAMFAPSAQSTPNMSILVSAGSVQATTGVVSKTSQTSSTITAPASGYQRIDRAVVNSTTGVLSIITGTPASSNPSAPNIALGYLPVARIGPILSSTTQITNALITDERTAFGAVALTAVDVGAVPVDVGAGNVGAIIMGTPKSGTTTTSGSTIAGANLSAVVIKSYQGNYIVGSVTGAHSGTWRNISLYSAVGDFSSSSGFAAMFQRIA